MSPAGAGGTGGAVVKKQKQLDILSMRGFASGISAEEKVKQDERDDAKWRERQALRKAEEERKEAARLANKRKPGRPPKKPTIIAISDDGDSREPAPKKVKAPGDKRQYTNWYVPLPFGPIHSAVASCSSYLRAVKYLQLHNADGRYDNLGESTVRKWYEQGSYTELTATAKAAVRKQCAMVRPYAGNKAALFKHPEAQTSIITVLQDMQTTGQLINSPLASSIIVGVLEAEAPTVLVRNGGNLLPSKSWVTSFLRTNLRWSYRKATTVAQKLPPNWASLLEDMNLRLAYKVFTLDIPKELVYQCDEMYLWYVPMANSNTYAPIGSKEVAVAGADDKRGATLNVTCKPDGSLGPFQIIYGGNTDRCLPKLEIRQELAKAGHVCHHTPSHWQTVESLKGWIEDLVLPDYKKVCEAQGRVYLQQCCIVHYDLYRVHVAEEFRTWLYSKYPFVHLGVVPGGCTGKGQVADIALNRPIKHALKQEFTKWSAGQIQEQITEIKANTPPGKKADLSSVKLDLRVGPLRNLTAVWAAKVHSQVKEMRETILRGYEIAGTDKIFDTEFQRRAMQEHERLFGGLDGKGLPSGAQQGAAFVPQEEQGEPANVEEDDEDIPLAEWAIRTREAEAAANARPNVAAGSSNRASNPLTRFVIWHPPTVDRHPDVFQAGTENEEEIPIASLLKSAQAAAAAQAVTDVSAD